MSPPDTQRDDTDAERRLNRNRELYLIAPAALFFAVVFAIIISAILVPLTGLLLLSIVVGIAIALTLTVLLQKRAMSMVLDLCEIDVAEPSRHARLINLVRGVCTAAGVSEPRLFVVNDPALNTMATGRDASDASLVVTSGLLESVDVVELEAVVAYQLSRIKSGEIATETLAVATAGLPLLLAEKVDRVEPLRRFFLLATPIYERVIRSLHPRTTDFHADIAAAGITRYPPGLARILTKMEGHSALSSASPVTAHLWMAPPCLPSTLRFVSAIHPPLSERVAILQEL